MYLYKPISVSDADLEKAYRCIEGKFLKEYERGFESTPAFCDVCRHRFKFSDRIAAAILLEAHDCKDFSSWLNLEPAYEECLDGIVLCPHCKAVCVTALRYPYPSDPDAQMPTRHAASELEAYINTL